MKRHLRETLGALLTTGIMLGVFALPAAAQTSGNESFDGTLTVSGTSGTRVVLASVVRMRGVFNGVGKIVEQPNQLGDPDNASRDNLVFAQGTIRIYNVNGDILSFSIDPNGCIVRGALAQSTTIVGGTGLFTGATGSFTGKVSILGQTSRTPDGACDLNQFQLLHEVDTVEGSGALTLAS